MCRKLNKCTHASFNYYMPWCSIHTRIEKVPSVLASIAKNLCKLLIVKVLICILSIKLHSCVFYVFSQVWLKLSSTPENKSCKKVHVLIVLVNTSVLCKNFMPYCTYKLGAPIILFTKQPFLFIEGCTAAQLVNKRIDKLCLFKPTQRKTSANL